MLLLLLVLFQLNNTYSQGLEIGRVRMIREPIYAQIPANIISKTNVMISSKIPGYITGLKVDIGDMVKRNSILLYIDKQTVEQKLKQARENLGKARAQLVIAEFNYNKFSKLYREGVISREKFLQMKTTYEAAKSSYKQAISGVKIAKTMLTYSVIRSPIDGVVSAKFVNNGDMAAMFQPLLSISSLDKLQVKANVSLSIVRLLKVSKWVEVDVGGKILRARISHISDVADPISRTFEIKADLPDGVGAKPGEFAYLVIKVGIKPTLVVNKSAVVIRGDIKGVFVVNSNGMVQFRIVRLGRTYRKYIEVLAGLFPDEKVVLNPPLGLKNGTHLTTNEIH